MSALDHIAPNQTGQWPRILMRVSEGGAKVEYKQFKTWDEARAESDVWTDDILDRLRPKAPKDPRWPKALYRWRADKAERESRVFASEADVPEGEGWAPLGDLPATWPGAPRDPLVVQLEAENAKLREELAAAATRLAELLEKPARKPRSATE